MAAAVVVANPVAPPVRDLQISTTQLTNPDALIPFDKNLLKSISQPSAASTFTAALAQILGALAAEADRIGTEVNSDLGTPVAPSASQTPPVNTPSSADIPPGATPNGTPSTSTTIAPEAVASATIAQVVSEITANTAYLGNNLVEAAYAAVGAFVNTPDVIFRAVKAVLAGDLMSAFKTIVQGVRAYFNPGLILVGGIDNVVDQYLPPKFTPGTGTVATNISGVAARPAATVGEGTSTTAPQTSTADPGSGNPRQTNSAGRARRAITGTISSINRLQLTPGSAASSPATGNPPSSADSASTEQPKSKSAGTDKPGSSAGRSQTAGGRGASAGD